MESSYRESRMQIEIYNGGNTRQTPINNNNNNIIYYGSPRLNMKKGGGGGGGSNNSKIWSFSDPEMKRKKRVASYKVYTMEGKMKRSLRKSFTWIKGMVSGWH